MADISTIKFENTIYNIKDNNALHSTDLPLAINKGGTNATNATTAIKNLFPNELASSSTNYFLTIDSNKYSKVGISSTTVLKNSLELGTGNNVVFKSLNVTSDADANSTVNNSVALIIGNPNGEHIEIDTNEIIGKSSATTGHTLAFNYDNDNPCLFGPGGIILENNSKLRFRDATGYIEYYDVAAYKTNRYGNFVHKRDTATDVFAICNNAGTATFRVQYESGTITAGKWNGTVIDIAHGGTGNTTGLAASATKLANVRTFHINLANTNAVSFDGSKNVEPGIKGILSVANGGTGVNSLSSGQLLLGNGTNDISTTSITKLTAVGPIASNAGVIGGSALRFWNGAYNSSNNSNLTKLGTITNGVWNGSVIDTKYGGTGGTDSGWIKLTGDNLNASLTTVASEKVIHYRNIGKMCIIRGSVALSTAVSGNVTMPLFTMPSNLKPTQNIYTTGGASNKLQLLILNTSGIASMYIRDGWALPGRINFTFNYLI